MINGIAFTGREEMLTKRAKSASEIAVEKVHEYVGDGKIFDPEEIKAVTGKVNEIKNNIALTQHTYTSPFAPTEAGSGSLDVLA